ncbi:MAG: hypothetical protein HY720_28420 [Planctomycetes bacterium]|nr:hypothetical protein [Planctomycetota bacterium]
MFYVPIRLYVGNVNLVAGGGSDWAKASREIHLIDRVFGRLPYPILYKPYRARRYLDEDPVLERARRSPNLLVFEKKTDLRYLFRYCWLIVTSRAPTALGLCLLSRRPLVRIDLPEEVALCDDTAEAFRKEVFYFDAGRSSFHDDLLPFPSRPRAEIESEWAAMAPDRERLIEEYVGRNDGRSGHRAAHRIVEWLRPAPQGFSGQIRRVST